MLARVGRGKVWAKVVDWAGSGPTTCAQILLRGAPGRGVLGGADPDWLSRQPFAEHGFTVRPIDDVVAALKGAGLATFVKSVQNPKSGVGYNFLACVPTADQSRGTH